MPEEGQYVIVDKGSSAGTYVNRKIIQGKQELSDGDIIEIGKTRIVFSESSERVCPGAAVRSEKAKFCRKCGLKAA